MIRKPTKLIRIRVSEEQFQTLKELSQRKGTRSIGGLALQMMHELIETPKAKLLTSQSSYLWTTELTNRLLSLQAEIERLEILLRLKK